MCSTAGAWRERRAFSVASRPSSSRAWGNSFWMASASVLVPGRGGTCWSCWKKAARVTATWTPDGVVDDAGLAQVHDADVLVGKEHQRQVAHGPPPRLLALRGEVAGLEFDPLDQDSVLRQGLGHAGRYLFGARDL